jgi:hypothetical protein
MTDFKDLTRFNLDLTPTRGFTMLVDGDRAAGKTYLLGDMLRTEKSRGPSYYLNVHKEDGYLTISQMGLGDIGIQINTIDQFRAFIAEGEKKPFHAIALDSLPMLAWLAIIKVTGSEDRQPIIPSRQQLEAGLKNEWPEVHRLMTTTILSARRACRFFVATSTIDKSAEMTDLSGMPRPKLIAPDLPGKQATLAGGWFDFVGRLKVRNTGPGRYMWEIQFNPDEQLLVRQRIPQMIKEPIVLPEGPGGWAAIKSVFVQHGGLDDAA